MKKMKRFLVAGLSLGLACGAFSAAALLHGKVSKSEAATNLGEIKYLPVNDTFFYKDNNSFDKSGTGVGGITSSKHATFHDGRRYYNALDNFINTMDVGEGHTGWIRSNEWVHTGGYVSFLLGGNSSCFVNIWAEPEGDLPGENVVDHAHTDFYASRDAFDDAYKNGEASDFELSANMALKFFQIPDRLIGRRLIVYMEDTATGYYGGIMFGNLRVNQTFEEVARQFAVHKLQVAIDGETTQQNKFSAEYVLKTYYAKEEYAALQTAAAALDNADDGFETYGLSNWAYDRAFATANIDVASIVSSNDAKDWQERMPANKSDNFYINADTSGIAEDQKYRLISPEFTLTGTGFVSAKLGGGTAVMSVIDDQGTELNSTRINPAEGTNILNKGFLDAGVANIMSSGARLNTMSRTYLDCSNNVGDKVSIILADERTGGNWGLAYFDEVVTKYTSTPKFKVDAIQQQWNDSPLYHGVVVDQYVDKDTSAETDFDKAYDFVTRYYGLMRNVANGVSWCTVSNNSDIKALLAEYKGLDADVKAIVSGSMDYSFGAEKTSENFFLSDVDLSFTIDHTMSALDSTLNASPSNFVQKFLNNDNSSTTLTVVSISVIALISLVSICLFLKKKKENQ